MPSLFQKIKKRLSRFIDGFSRYNYPPSNDGWIQEKKPIVDGEDILFDPYVLADTSYVYVSNRSKNAICRYYFDVENILLENPVPVLFGTPGRWDETVNRACILKQGNVFYCWYVGQSGGKSRIGMAISSDGIHFEKRNEPVLDANQPFEKSSVMNPCVLFYDNAFHMWYSAGDDYEPDVICYATSKDGVHWDKKGEPVLTKGNHFYDKAKVGGCEVLKTADGFSMFYIGYQTEHNARICQAFSLDGLSWDRGEANPILSAVKHSWNADAVYKPAYLSAGAKEFLLFNGRKGNQETIGVAIRKNLKDLK